MAFTKLYLSADAPLYTPDTIRGAWDASGSAVTRGLQVDKTRGGVNTSVVVAETSTDTEYDVLLYRGVSPPLAAQTISGTVNMMVGIDSSNSDADFHWHVHLYATTGDTDTPRGTLLTDYREDLGVNEWPQFDTVKRLNAAATLSSLAISAGDRLVLEVGYVARNNFATSRQGRLYYGTLSRTTSDVLADGTDGSNVPDERASYIEFSGSITELSYETQIAQLGAQTLLGLTAISNTRLFQFGVQTLQPTTIADTAALRIFQIGAQTLQAMPLYDTGPPDPGEDPCLQTSFQAWVELDL